MRLEPLQDRILVKQVEKEEETISGGIILPDVNKEKPLEGRVVAVGPGKVLGNGALLPMTLKYGELVAFGKYSGTEVVLNDKTYLILREEEVLGRIVEGD